MSIRLWKYYWHLVIILSLIIFALWMQNPPANKSMSMNCKTNGCENIPLSFTQTYNPSGIALVSRPYLLMINPNETENARK